MAPCHLCVVLNHLVSKRLLEWSELAFWWFLPLYSCIPFCSVSICMGRGLRGKGCLSLQVCVPPSFQNLSFCLRSGRGRNFPAEVEGYRVSGGINGQDTSELQTPKIMWDLMPSNYRRWTGIWRNLRLTPTPTFVIQMPLVHCARWLIWMSSRCCL